jgi:hypothetical protein
MSENERAQESALRLINSHFNQKPRARASIPARPDYDDDLILMAYLRGLNNLEAECVRLREALEEIAADAYHANWSLLAAQALEPTAEKASEKETPNF